MPYNVIYFLTNWLVQKYALLHGVCSRRRQKLWTARHLSSKNYSLMRTGDQHSLNF